MKDNQTKTVKAWAKLSATALYGIYGGLDGMLDLKSDAVIIKFLKNNGRAMYFEDIILNELLNDIESGEDCFLVGYYDDVRSIKSGQPTTAACTLNAAITRYILYDDDYYVINMEWGDFFEIGTYALDELKRMCEDNNVFVVPKCLIEGDKPEE